MSRSQQTYAKRQRELKRQKRKERKAERKTERAATSPGGGLENMLAYVDENGQLTSEPQPLVPEQKTEEER